MNFFILGEFPELLENFRIPELSAHVHYDARDIITEFRIANEGDSEQGGGQGGQQRADRI